jgi:hypothetical protein
MNHPIITRLRDLLHAQPFHPFTIHLINGTKYSVPHEDFLFLGKSGNVIYDDGEHIKSINATIVAEIDEKVSA